MAGEDLLLRSNFLLDTGIIIGHLRKDKRANDLLDHLERIGELSVSTITYMEILILCKPHEEESTRLFFERVLPIVVNREVAQKAASLIKSYPEVFDKSNPRQFPDALIGATAWQQGSTLVTLNTQHFTKTPINEFSILAIEQNTSNWITQIIK